MSKDIVNSIILAGMFLSLFGVAELLYHKTNLQGDDTRKVVHIGTGLLSMLFPVMLQSHWWVLALCTSFAIILFASLKFDLLKSINKIDRVSHGSLLYPLAVYGSFVAYNYFGNNYLYFYLPVLIMALCDPLAAIVGKKFPYGKFYIAKDKKTLLGCSAFFVGSVIVSSVLLAVLPGAHNSTTEILLITGLTAIAATFAEAVSVKGLDNLTIPISVLLVLTLLHV